MFLITSFINTPYIQNIFNLQAKLQQDVVNNHDCKYQTDMQILRSQLLDITKEKEQEISTRKAMETELRTRAAELSKGITTLEAELYAKRQEDKTKVN